MHLLKPSIFSLLFVYIISTLLSCSKTSDTVTEDEAMTFLYASMALPDSTDYSEQFYRRQIRTSLQARQEMPWGMQIPKREWMHFVQPLRVNNENLDTFRLAMYDELKARVEGMTMEEAALEVNHWCHEHVSYQPSDARTSSPLATIRSAIGRCGEESTLTVAALRTIGIPARQVYTPRWAHTDDNHAWVEAWIDGEWKFMGACEPEPVLNLGWFNAPASRAMLMHTKAFGNYDGPERVMTKTECYTEIDVTDTYAPTSVFDVQVVNDKGKPVKDATVQFRLYNYAEFFPLNTKQTDKQGRCDFKAGHGTLLVWATDGKHFGFEKIQVGTSTQPLRIILDKDVSNIGRHEPHTFDIDVVPPKERNTIPAMTNEQIERNKQRLAYEDSVRNAYIATFYNIMEDNSPTGDILRKSRGNHNTINKFINGTTDKKKALRLLSLLSEKDLRDVPSDVLQDNYELAPDTLPYIFCQRISNELLTPYRAEFLKLFSKNEQQTYRQDPNLLAERIERDFILDEEHNPQQLCMQPVKAWQTKRCDRHSRDIMFVAILRTLGVEARIDEVTGKVQWRAKAESLQAGRREEQPWQTVFVEKSETKAKQGKLHLTYTGTTALTDPHYNTNFTLSKLENGVPVLLNYPECEAFSKIFSNSVLLDEGTYILTTGTRLAQGDVLSQMTFFEIKADEQTELPLTFRTSTDEVQVIGSFGSETRYTPAFIFDNEKVSIAGMPSTDFNSVDLLPENSILSTTGRGYYVIGLLSVGSEPTNHALNDLSAAKSELETWGRPILLVANNEAELASIKKDFPKLPTTVCFGIDTTGKIRKGMQSAVQGESISNMPVFLIADTFDRVVFLRQGYTIGLGEQIIKTVRKL